MAAGLINVSWLVPATAILMAVVASATHRRYLHREDPARTPAVAEVIFDPVAINSPALLDPVQDESKGSAVLRAQILLARAHFSCGEMDGAFGSNLRKTVAAFQQSRNLPPTGNVDAGTWAVLNQDKAPALTPYTIANDDAAGPFFDVPPNLMHQAKLPALGFSSPQELLGEKFHLSPVVLTNLNLGKNLAQAGEQILVPNVLVMPPPPASQVVISKSDSSVMVLDANGSMLAYYSATIGSQHDPLPVGTWNIRYVARNPWFHYNAELFWDAHNPSEKAVIRPGPNSPVGVVWIDLSKDHYGIHGTPEPSKVGHAFSHGCVRLTNWDAAELASIVQPGTPAILKE